MEETRPGEYLPIEENERGTFIFNSKDLCMAEHIPELVDAGIDSFKIEGRMKTALYVATVARTYRRAIDAALESPEAYEKELAWCKEQIGKCTYRKFNSGFYFGRPDSDSHIYDNSTYEQDAVYRGRVEKSDCPEDDSVDGEFIINVIQKNKFCVGDTIEIMKPDGRDIQARVIWIENESGERQDNAPHARQKLRVSLSAEAEHGDILRMNH